MSFVLRTYDYLRTRRGLCLTFLLLLTVVLVALLSRQHYKEDISDFLPLDSKYGQALKVYQEISGASRIVAILETRDSLSDQSSEKMMEAVDAFAAIVQERDTMGVSESMITQVDVEQVETMTQFVYANMPYFLADRDYARMDSLLGVEGFVEKQLAADKQMLLFPMAGMMAQNVQRDPLNLFTPVTASLQQPLSVSYENYDGYIFTPDMSRAIVLMQSPFGGSETSDNARLLRFLKDCAADVDVSGVDIHFTGGPVIAVGNAEQIKRDSILAVSLALILIVGLLYVVFRRVRSLLLIVLSIGWGWLFAMAALALLLDSVSVIVIGISSVIVGIAVNYPLHLIAHLRHTPGVRQALREIVAPLIVGNITTVGAFLALVPLESVALRDLGLFSSLLLVGTILFVLIFLPQLISSRQRFQTLQQSRENKSYGKSEGVRAYPMWIPAVIVLLTFVLGYFSLNTTFDANIANINYMTEQQRHDMEYLASNLNAQTSTLNSQFSILNSQTVYVVSSDATLDAALSRSAALHPVLEQLKADGKVCAVSSCYPFLCSLQEQEHRLSLWREFVSRYGDRLETGIRQAARAEGFAEDTFDEFFTLLRDDYQPQSQDYFAPLTSTVFSSCLAASDSTCSVVETLTVDGSLAVSDIEAAIKNHGDGRSYAFDVQMMNSTIATHLSDDFNYIGWACGLIVFLFLWFSLGSLELALMSFLPMAVSWVWILGLMSLLGIHFNVVNIILATFIFGQGDDYTIFMTEGCQYEYAYRRPMLASYKQSIILSALIMFIGIGALIFAQHPALRSLAQVTIVGMFSVVLMAWLLPPIIFRWLVANRNGYRQRPLSLSLLWRSVVGRASERDSSDNLRHLVYDRYRYKGMGITNTVGRNLRLFKGICNPSTPVQGDLQSAQGNLHSPHSIAVINSGYGELPLLLALQHPDATIFAIEADPEKLLVARNSAEQLVSNITFLERTGPEQLAQLQAANPGLQLVTLTPH